MGSRVMRALPMATAHYTLKVDDGPSISRLVSRELPRWVGEGLSAALHSYLSPGFLTPRSHVEFSGFL